MSIKQNFFDADKIIRELDRAKRQSLSRAGAFIRTDARRSIRKAPPRVTKTGRRSKAKRVSPPGQPPKSHEGSLRRLILFGFDRDTGSVVIGPVGFASSSAPITLEEGGMVRIVNRRNGRVSRSTARIKPRPYMTPALNKNLSKLPEQFRNSVRGSGG